MAAKSRRLFDRASTRAEAAVADIFSNTILEYSVGEHLPRDINRVR
jgi:hypothetical protein